MQKHTRYLYSLTRLRELIHFLVYSQGVGNQNLMKKLPEGYEACNILCGEVPSLDNKVSVLIRLKESCQLNNLSEVMLITFLASVSTWLVI